MVSAKSRIGGSTSVRSDALAVEAGLVLRHMMPMLITTEQTPNPSTRKFLPGVPVMESGSRDFPTAEAAEASPLAAARRR